MPKTYSITEIKENFSILPTSSGCYIYMNKTTEIYIGKAKNIRNRVRSYFRKQKVPMPRLEELIENATSIKIINTDSEIEALLLENNLIKDFQPKYNVLLKDDKDYPLLAITKEEYPKVFITRDKNTNAHLYGPFISSTELRQAYHFLMKVFRFRTCDIGITEKRKKHFKPCLHYHIKQCSAPCTKKYDKKQYQEDISALRKFITGKDKQGFVKKIKNLMNSSSENEDYEKAAKYRDQLNILNGLKNKGNLSDYSKTIIKEKDSSKGLEKLKSDLSLPILPRIIECFDIAHLQGEETVASMVQFINGQPNNEAYRRYKILSENSKGNDDVASISEVVERRYKRVVKENLPVPDIILIDGGIAQVKASEKILKKINCKPLLLIGIAKAEETIVFTNGKELKLGTRNAGLKILTQARDEAHRFCRRYHHLLRQKKLK